MIDPANGVDQIQDVYFRDGVIVGTPQKASCSQGVNVDTESSAKRRRVEEHNPRDSHVFDASELLVVPGLVYVTMSTNAV